MLFSVSADFLLAYVYKRPTYNKGPFAQEIFEKREFGVDDRSFMKLKSNGFQSSKLLNSDRQNAIFKEKTGPRNLPVLLKHLTQI